MQKSSSKNVCENYVKIVKKYVKMGAEIVEKSVKNRLRNHCGNLLVKMLNKCAQGGPKGAQGPTMSRGLVGPECR